MRGKIRLDGRKHCETDKGFPVVIYLTKDNKEKLILTGYHSKKEHWDKINSLPTKKHPDFLNLLNFIELKKIRLFKLLDKAKKENISLNKAETILKGFDTGIFYKDASNLELNRAYETALNSFNKYFPEYSYAEITKKTVETYVNILLKTKVNGKPRNPNGVISYLERLKASWNKLDKEDNPFNSVRIIPIKTKKKALIDEDLVKLKEHNYKPHPNSKQGGIYNYINYWLLCFYLGGIDLVDLKNLKRKDIVNNRIEFTRSKGGTNVFVSNFIFPQAQEILDQYKDKTYLVPLARMKDYNMFIPNMSRHFEKIQKDLGLSRKPYSKAARHTFITRAQQLLIDERIAIEIVGHAQTSTHSIYKDEFPYSVRDEAHKKIIDF